MKKLIISSAIFSFLIANNAFAKAEIFSGPSILLGAQSISSDSEFKEVSFAENNFGESSMTAVLGGSYLQKINCDWLIGAGLSYDLTDPKKNKNRSLTPVVEDNTDGVLTISTKNHFSVYIQPTYAANEVVAIFGKLGYHRTKVKISDPAGPFIGDLSYSSHLNGIGYGFGLMAFLNKNLYLKAEIERVNYETTNITYRPIIDMVTIKYKLSSTAGIFSLGYRF